MRWSAGRVALAAAVRGTRADLTLPSTAFAGQVLLRVEGDSLTVVGRDAFVTVATSVPVKSAAEGAACVNQKRLDDLLHAITADEVTGAIVGDQLKITGGGSVARLVTNDTTAFPVDTLDQVATVRLEPGVLIRCLRRVADAAHEQATHPSLSGVHVFCRGGWIRVEAGNSRRFASAREAATSDSFEAILNRRVCRKLLDLLDDAEETSLQRDASRIGIGWRTTTIIGLEQAVPFPALDDSLVEEAVASCVVARAALREAAETFAAISEDAPVRVSFEQRGLRLSLKSTNGSAEKNIACPIAGRHKSLAVRLMDLKLACAGIDVDTVRVSARDGTYGSLKIEGETATSEMNWSLIPISDVATAESATRD